MAEKNGESKNVETKQHASIEENLEQKADVVELVEFDTTETAAANKEDALLGEILKWLRENKLMSTLMICRQIESIKIQDGIAELSFGRGGLDELVLNEKHKVELEKFFKAKGLSYKIKGKTKNISPIQALNELFGDKLIIK